MGTWKALVDQDGFTTNIHRPVRRRAGSAPTTAFRKELGRLKADLLASGRTGGTWSTLLKAAEMEFDRMPETLRLMHETASGLVVSWAKDFGATLSVIADEDRFEVVLPSWTPPANPQMAGIQPKLFDGF